MKIQPTTIPGAYLLEFARHVDERGHFLRTFDADEFRAHGLDPHVAQTSVAHNAKTGTLRGMHWQAEPHGEQKLVRCARGALFDVIVDVRPTSPAFRRWYSVELREDVPRMLLVPPGVAHGYQTLTDGTDVAYQMNVAHSPSSARGFRWDDERIAIGWPEVRERILNERDRQLPPLRP